MIKTQKEVDERVTEIQGMSDEQLVWALCHEAGWHYMAVNEMKKELAENTEKDMDLLKIEILKRMSEIKYRNRITNSPQSG